MKRITPDIFLSHTEIPIIDVRSPNEFEQGHIVGAINIPLFTDEERAEVGTIYKKSGKNAALFIGLDKVGTKMSGFLKKAIALSHQSKSLRVYCWRGGMRSQSMAWLFEQGSIKTYVLEGGYKAYRSYIREQWSNQHQLIILGGMTGSGKTEILHEIKKLGEQVLDLEQVAHHKGSAFGAIGQTEQVSNEQFENNLYEHWKKLSFKKPIWVEDESRSIGKNSIPDPLYLKMRNAPVIKVDIPKALRIKRLVKEYAYVDHAALIDAVHRIRKKLGLQHEKDAINALENKNYEKVADITLTYYDKAYLNGLSKRPHQNIHTLQLDKDIPKENAEKIILFLREKEEKKAKTQ